MTTPSNSNQGYVLTEIWKARPAWSALSAEERAKYFDGEINRFLGEMIGAGAELLACAYNDNDGSERINYDFMAVWRLPSKEFSNNLEAGAKALGFLDYFEQANFSGEIISPPVLNQLMIDA